MMRHKWIDCSVLSLELKLLSLFASYVYLYTIFSQNPLYKQISFTSQSPPLNAKEARKNNVTNTLKTRHFVYLHAIGRNWESHASDRWGGVMLFIHTISYFRVNHYTETSKL